MFFLDTAEAHAICTLMVHIWTADKNIHVQGKEFEYKNHQLKMEPH